MCGGNFNSGQNLYVVCSLSSSISVFDRVQVTIVWYLSSCSVAWGHTHGFEKKKQLYCCKLNEGNWYYKVASPLKSILKREGGGGKTILPTVHWYWNWLFLSKFSTHCMYSRYEAWTPQQHTQYMCMHMHTDTVCSNTMQCTRCCLR